MKRSNWTKKATILLAAICVALAGLSAYSAKPAQDWLLQVEGAPVSRETYCYFLAEELALAERDEAGVPLDMALLRENVKARCAAYVAVNSELRIMRKVLDQPLKAQVAERSAYLWRVYHNYYEAIGVSKPTVTAVQGGLAAKEQLFRALYDAGGPRAVPEDSLHAYFYGNFVAYDGVRVFFKAMEETGEERDITETEKEQKIAAMKNLAEESNSEEGGDFFELAMDDLYAAAMSYAMPAINVLQKDVDMPVADFERVRGLDPLKVTVLQTPTCLVVARGVNMRLEEDEFYNSYRGACLRALKWAEYEETLEGLYKAFRADENVRAVDALLKGFPWGWGK